MKVLVYVNTSKEVGDVDHLKIFADEDAAEAWFTANDPEGVAFQYDVIETPRGDWFQTRIDQPKRK